MKRFGLVLLAAGLLVMLTGTSFAQERRGPPEGRGRGEMRGRSDLGELLRRLPPERRHQIMTRLRNATPEERQKLLAKWRNASPEEKRALAEKLGGTAAPKAMEKAEKAQKKSVRVKKEKVRPKAGRRDRGRAHDRRRVAPHPDRRMDRRMGRRGRAMTMRRSFADGRRARMLRRGTAWRHGHGARRFGRMGPMEHGRRMDLRRFGRGFAHAPMHGDRRVMRGGRGLLGDPRWTRGRDSRTMRGGHRPGWQGRGPMHGERGPGWQGRGPMRGERGPGWWFDR